MRTMEAEKNAVEEDNLELLEVLNDVKEDLNRPNPADVLSEYPSESVNEEGSGNNSVLSSRADFNDDSLDDDQSLDFIEKEERREAPPSNRETI